MKQLLILLTLLLVPSFCYSANSYIRVDTIEKKYDAGSQLSVLEDFEGNLTAQSLLSFDNSDFRSPDRPQVIGGYGSSVLWGKLTLENGSRETQELCFEMKNKLLNQVEFFVFSGKDLVYQEVWNNQEGRNGSELLGRLVFHISVEPGLFTVLYRVKTGGLVDIIPVIWKQSAFRKQTNRNLLLFGFFYGVILLITVFSLFQFIILREKTYLFYTLLYMSFGVIMFIVNGHWSIVLPVLRSGAMVVLSLAAISYVVFQALFVMSYLNVRRYYPWAYSFLSFIWKTVLMGVVPLLLGYYGFVLTMAVVYITATFFIAFAVSIKQVSQGIKAAIFFAMALLFFFIGTGTMLISSFSHLFDEDIMGLVHRGTSIVEMILFAFAMFVKVQYNKHEMDELKSHFEDKVATRTEELNTSLTLLQKKEKEIEQELNLAGDIQRGILPDMPYEKAGLKIDAYYQSMFQIGGDFYDIFRMPGGFTGILIADASGHGMPAAFITALAKISFSEAIQRYLFPSEIFSHVNADLIKTVKTDDFVTAFFVVISPTRELFYCNAAHNLAYLYRKKEQAIEELDSDGLFLGYVIEANSRYSDGISTLDYGDRLVLYTDGIPECKNLLGETFGYDRLKDAIVETAALPVEEARKAILHQWLAFRGSMAQTDDATLMIIEYDPEYEDFSNFRDEGFAQLNESNYAKAILYLEKALSINRFDEQANLFMGEAKLNQGRYDEAIVHFNFFLESNKFDANVWHHYGMAQFHLGDFNEALTAMTKSLKLRPDSIEGVALMAQCLEKQGRREDAKRKWEKVLSLDPNHELAKEKINDLS